MQEVILLKLGEIVLKGQNRRSFEETLLKNIRRRIAPKGEYRVSISQSTVYVEPQRDDCDLDECEEKIRKIFGVVAYSRACIADKDMSAIQKAAAEYLADELNSISVFKVESKRADKKFPFKSPEISSEVGGYLLEKFPHLAVDVHEPELTVRVEIREKGAYIHSDPKPGAGGIPVGTGGKAAILISGGIDSPVAAWMMARRGVELTAIHFASPPYTSERAQDKVERLLKKVSEYAGRITMYVVNFTKIQEQIRDYCPEELSTVIMRRFMMRVAEKIARKEDCHALITGESLGQVASQTMHAIECTESVASIPVYRPLIGTDKAEIVRIAREIDTFDTSIEPFEDCCTVFTPKHPRTKPTPNLLKSGESRLDVDSLVLECLSNLEVKVIVGSGIRKSETASISVGSRENETLSEKLVRLLSENRKKVAFAESCTGGLMAKLVTDVPGSSEVFEMGCVTYANSVKEKLLGVRHETLEAFGAVSEQTAREMAEGIRALSGADYGISATGVAGPGGGTDEKPVGLVYIGLSDGENTYVCRRLPKGEEKSRDYNRKDSAKTAFDMLVRLIEGKSVPLTKD